MVRRMVLFFFVTDLFKTSEIHKYNNNTCHETQLRQILPYSYIRYTVYVVGTFIVLLVIITNVSSYCFSQESFF